MLFPQRSPTYAAADSRAAFLVSMRGKGSFGGTDGSQCISPTNVKLCKTKRLFPTYQGGVTQMQMNEREETGGGRGTAKAG